MKLLKVNLKKQINHSYPIVIGSREILQLPTQIKLLGSYSKIAVITDSNTNKLYGEKIKNILLKTKIKSQVLTFASGEKSKTQQTKTAIEEAMLKSRFDRKSLILALGGGVVGDMAGFVAATYMRGIDYIQVPTTLLAMVDSSVGGKTGIDTAQGKNMIGSFWQPKLVLIDLDFLKTLPKKHLINGLVEAFKMFLTHDAKSFEYSEKNLNKILKKDLRVLEKIIALSLKIKTETIMKDERELGPRMFLNFGHTIGHALEKASGYKFLHGEAVALGILAESKISLNLGILARKDYNRIANFFKRLWFDGNQLKRFNQKQIIGFTKGDKKSKGGQARYILLERIGKVYTKNHKLAYKVNKAVVKKSLVN